MTFIQSIAFLLFLLQVFNGYQSSGRVMLVETESDSNRRSASKPQQARALRANRKWISPEEQKILVCMDVDCDIQTNLDDHVTIMCCSVSTTKPTTEIITTEPFPTTTVPTVATST